MEVDAGVLGRCFFLYKLCLISALGSWELEELGARAELHAFRFRSARELLAFVPSSLKSCQGEIPEEECSPEAKFFLSFFC